MFLGKFLAVLQQHLNIFQLFGIVRNEAIIIGLVLFQTANLFRRPCWLFDNHRILRLNRRHVQSLIQKTIVYFHITIVTIHFGHKTEWYVRFTKQLLIYHVNCAHPPVSVNAGVGARPTTHCNQPTTPRDPDVATRKPIICLMLAVGRRGWWASSAV